MPQLCRIQATSCVWWERKTLQHYSPKTAIQQAINCCPHLCCVGHSSCAKTVDKLAPTYYFSAGGKKKEILFWYLWIHLFWMKCGVCEYIVLNEGTQGSWKCWWISDTFFPPRQHLFQYFLKVRSCRMLDVKLPLVVLLLKLELILPSSILPEWLQALQVWCFRLLNDCLLLMVYGAGFWAWFWDSSHCVLCFWAWSGGTFGHSLVGSTSHSSRQCFRGSQSSTDASSPGLFNGEHEWGGENLPFSIG